MRTFAEIGARYDRLAASYDRGPSQWTPHLRQRLLARARGRVLEVGLGTGANLRFYPRSFREGRSDGEIVGWRRGREHQPAASIVGIDASARMLAIARVRAMQLELPLEVRVMDAEQLDFVDQSFDTVVCTFSACVFNEPVKAWREMARVVKRRGSILLLEHSRPHRLGIGPILDLLTPLTRCWSGCHLNRDTLADLQEAGVVIVDDLRVGQRSFIRCLEVTTAGDEPP